jgi:hypothetical protein
MQGLPREAVHLIKTYLYQCTFKLVLEGSRVIEDTWSRCKWDDGWWAEARTRDAILLKICQEIAWACRNKSSKSSNTTCEFSSPAFGFVVDFDTQKRWLVRGQHERVHRKISVALRCADEVPSFHAAGSIDKRPDGEWELADWKIIDTDTQDQDALRDANKRLLRALTLGLASELRGQFTVTAGNSTKSVNASCALVGQQDRFSRTARFVV